MAGHLERSAEETLSSPRPTSRRGSLATFARSAFRHRKGRRQSKRFYRLQIERLESRELLSVDAWPMRQGDIWNTGRADFDVPDSRLNGQFFDIFRWQTRTPGSPNEGAVDGASMVFYDGAGPGGANLMVGGYHWPKGIQGMDRHTGRAFWAGNPAGDEAIATITPAFSNDGSVLYVTNDAIKQAFIEALSSPVDCEVRPPTLTTNLSLQEFVTRGRLARKCGVGALHRPCVGWGYA